MDDDLFDDLYETENIRGDNSTIDSELQEHLQNIPDIETVMARTEAEVAGGVADPRYQHDTSSDEGDDNSDGKLEMKKKPQPVLPLPLPQSLPLNRRSPMRARLRQRRRRNKARQKKLLLLLPLVMSPLTNSC